MKYLNIIAACAAEPWALQQDKLEAIADFLRFKARGGEYSADEVAKITQKTERQMQRAEGNVGVIPVHGVIAEKMNLLDEISGGTSCQMIASQFRAALNDSSIKAIMFDYHTPGGTARGVEELGLEIFEARGIKPMIAMIDSCCGSAGFWLATQADEVVVTPSGQAGSIGVYAMHSDISEMLAKEGVKQTLVSSDPKKILGNQLEPLSDDARSEIQKKVDGLSASFVRSVARGRGTSIKDVTENYGQGLTFDAQDLLARGMVDAIATKAETLARFGIELNPALSRARAQVKGAKAAETGPAEVSIVKRLEEWGRSLRGEAPSLPPSHFEDILREAGVPKSLSARIASRVHGEVRSESGVISEATTAAVQKVQDAIARLQSLGSKT